MKTELHKLPYEEGGHPSIDPHQWMALTAKSLTERMRRGKPTVSTLSILFGEKNDQTAVYNVTDLVPNGQVISVGHALVKARDASAYLLFIVTSGGDYAKGNLAAIAMEGCCMSEAILYKPETHEMAETNERDNIRQCLGWLLDKDDVKPWSIITDEPPAPGEAFH